MNKKDKLTNKVAVSPSTAMICSTAVDQHEPLSVDDWAEQWTTHLDQCASCRRENKCAAGIQIYFQDVREER